MGVGIIAGLFTPGLAAVPLLPQSMQKKAMLPCVRNWYRDCCGRVVRIPPSQVWPESLSEYVTFRYFLAVSVEPWEPVSHVSLLQGF